MKRERTPEPDAELVTVVKCAPHNGTCVTKIVSVHKAAGKRSSRDVAKKAMLVDIVESVSSRYAKVLWDTDDYAKEGVLRVRIWKEKATADTWDKTATYWLETLPLIKPVRNKLAKLGFNLA